MLVSSRIVRSWQVAVMAVCGVIAFFMADLPYYKNAAQYPGTSLSSPYLPVILSMLASYIIAECFFNVRRAAPRPAFSCLTASCESMLRMSGLHQLEHRADHASLKLSRPSGATPPRSNKDTLSSACAACQVGTMAVAMAMLSFCMTAGRTCM